MLKTGFIGTVVVATATSILLAGLTINRTQAKSFRPRKYRTVNVQQFVNRNNLAGLNPNQTAVKLFADIEEAEGRKSESLDIKYAGQKAVIFVVKNGLADDSVRALRTRVEMQRNTNGKWLVAWVGEQYKCQRGRGSQSWSPKLCS